MIRAIYARLYVPIGPLRWLSTRNNLGPSTVSPGLSFQKRTKKSVPKVNVLTLTHLDQYISLDIGDNKSEKNNV
jgi:hypothetical protein